MRDEFPASDLPNPALSFEAATAYELLVVAEAYGCDSVLVGVVDLPKRLRSLNLE